MFKADYIYFFNVSYHFFFLWKVKVFALSKNFLQFLNFSVIDFRGSKWFLSNSYYYPVFLVAAYLLFVYYGPKFMKNRKPMKLKYVLIAHNFFQIMLSGYIFKEVVTCIFTIKELNFWCYMLDQSSNPHALRVSKYFLLQFLVIP